MSQSLYQTFVIRPLVRSILGALGLLTTEEQIDSFIGSVIRQFVENRQEATVYPRGDNADPLRAWIILSQMDVDVGLSSVKVQSVLNSIYGWNLRDSEAERLKEMVKSGDQIGFLTALVEIGK